MKNLTHGKFHDVSVHVSVFAILTANIQTIKVLKSTQIGKYFQVYYMQMSIQFEPKCSMWTE